MSHLETAGNSLPSVKAIAQQLHSLKDAAEMQAELCNIDRKHQEVKEDVPDICHKEVCALCWQHSESNL